MGTAFNNKLVTASPSGNFSIFDLNRGRFGRFQLLKTIQADIQLTEKEISGGHPRPLNVIKLCQQPSHGYMLVTGGTEGQAKIWVCAVTPFLS